MQKLIATHEFGPFLAETIMKIEILSKDGINSIYVTVNYANLKNAIAKKKATANVEYFKICNSSSSIY